MRPAPQRSDFARERCAVTDRQFGELRELGLDAAADRDADLLALARRVEQVIGRIPGPLGGEKLSMRLSCVESDVRE